MNVIDDKQLMDGVVTPTLDRLEKTTIPLLAQSISTELAQAQAALAGEVANVQEVLQRLADRIDPIVAQLDEFNKTFAALEKKLETLVVKFGV
jgi:ABC-type transporter Mla subunit MlaD